MSVFEERGKQEHPEKNLSEQSREPTTKPTHIRRWVQKSNPGHIGGRKFYCQKQHKSFDGTEIGLLLSLAYVILCKTK